jgi:antitoxin (DNA-binding transcriptional repressor) of toxin-antitoxin stability system
MRTVGIRTLKNEATTLLQANETLIVERHGAPVGVYIPLAATDRSARAQSLAAFGATLQTFLAAHGVTEEELAVALSASVPDKVLPDEVAIDAPGR